MLRRPKVFDCPEFRVFKKLNTPAKIQDFVDKIPMNFSTTCRSPLTVLRKNRAYCIEGAFLAAAIFWYHGRPPLVFCLNTVDPDFDHVLAVFSAESGLREDALNINNNNTIDYGKMGRVFRDALQGMG